MNREEIDYWLKEFYDRKHAFMSKDGKVLVYYKIFEELKKLQQENQQLKENNLAMQEEMARTWKKLDTLKKLRSWLEEQWEQSQDIWFIKIINKLNDLEGGKNE